MKIAIISDIHGNYKAYEACLEYLQKQQVDSLFFLGDYITDSPYPQKFLRLLYETQREKNCLFVRGNREEYILENERKPQGWHRSSGSGVLLYTAERLEKKDIAFINRCPVILRPETEKLPPVTLCHGIPEDTRGNVGEFPLLLPQALKQAKTKYLFGGHSHKQEVRKTSEGIYLNPGSLGLAIDGVGARAQFAIVTVDKTEYREEFISIPYDIEGLMKDFEESGIADYGYVQVRSVKKTMQTGINYFFECIKLVTKLSGKSPDRTPEDIWERAAKELEL